MSRLSDRTLALAGIFQAARLTQQLARQGRADPSALAASIRSILRLEAASTEEVYGSPQGVQLGLTLLRDKLTGRTDAADVELARYVIALTQVERRLRRQPAMLEALRQSIEALPPAGPGEDGEQPVAPDLIDKLATLYLQTISTLTPRIMVNGEHGYLADPQIAARVRAALFAGVRSAVLWRQLGGRRWHLLVARTQIAEAAKQLLSAGGDS